MKCRATTSAGIGLVWTCLLAASAVAQTHKRPVSPPHTYDPPDAVYNPKPGTAPLAHPQAHANVVTTNTTSWTLLGPASLNNGDSESGRMAGVAVDPANSSNLYIAAAGGGVWQSTDGGTTYNPLTDPCGKLFYLTKTSQSMPTDTVTGAMNIAQNPDVNVALLNDLQAPSRLSASTRRRMPGPLQLPTRAAD